MKILTPCVWDGAPVCLMSSWMMWILLVYGLRFGQQPSRKTMCLEYMHGVYPGGKKKSFASVDSETHMPLRTRRYLCSLYNFCLLEAVPRLMNIWARSYLKVKGKDHWAQSLQVDCRTQLGDTAFLWVSTEMKCSHISSFPKIIGVIVLYSYMAVLLPASVTWVFTKPYKNLTT